MIRVARCALALALLLLPTMRLAQQAAPSSSLPDWSAAQPALAGNSDTVSGEAVVDLADFIAGNLAASGSIPELVQVKTTNGALRTLTAAETFALLARTTYLWQTAGVMPATVPIMPDQLRPPILDQEDVVAPPDDETAGRQVPTESFLSQCPAVVRWVDRLRVVPTAVNFDGLRLSAAEYLSGLAICISYTYWEGELEESIFLPAYAPPKSWTAGLEMAAASDESEVTGTVSEEETTSASEEPEAPKPATVLGADESGEGYEQEFLGEGEDDYSEDAAWDSNEVSDEEAFSEEAEQAESSSAPVVGPEPGATQPVKLTVIPEPGETVRGVVDLVASYRGPPAKYVIFTIQGKGAVIMNAPPYSARWDTATLKPGLYQVRLQVFDAADATLADLTSIYTVVAPPPKKDPGTVRSK